MTNDPSQPHTRPTRLEHHKAFKPSLDGLPNLPAIDWNRIDASPPKLLDTPANWLPEADAVVITWASAEWAAMEHVFVSSDQAMPYADRYDHWPGWQKYDHDLPSYSGWYEWGFTRLVEIAGKKVLLFKSNTHLDWPGESYLEEMTEKICEYVEPELLLSIGTAGGSRLQDKIGTVNTIHTGTLYEEGKPQNGWPVYSNAWRPSWSILERSGFSDLLFPIPIKKSDLKILAKAFNEHYGTDYPLSELNAKDLDMPDAQPKIHDLTGEDTSLLTTSTFVVANTSGNYEDYAVIEMDDAILGKVCNEHDVPFGFVRNVSDPAQNAELPTETQGNWGSTLYDAYGLYTSYNGALAAWAMLEGGEKVHHKS